MLVSRELRVEGLDNCIFSMVKQEEVTQLPEKLTFPVTKIMPDFESYLKIFEKYPKKVEEYVSDVHFYWPLRGTSLYNHMNHSPL